MGLNNWFVITMLRIGLVAFSVSSVSGCTGIEPDKRFLSFTEKCLANAKRECVS